MEPARVGRECARRCEGGIRGSVKVTRKDGGLRLQALKYSMRWSSSASWAMALYLCPRAAMGAEKPSAALSRLTETFVGP